MSDSCPDKLRLIACLESPDSNDAKDVRRHLVSCASCRNTLSIIQTMIKTIKLAPPSDNKVSAGTHLDEQAIADFIEDRSTLDEKRYAHEHLNGCDLCSKWALHYILHSRELQRAISAQSASAEDVAASIEARNPATETKSVKPSYKRIFSWQIPFWIGIPATAAATILLMVFLFRYGDYDRGQISKVSQEKKIKIIMSYQENPQIIISPKIRDMPFGFAYAPQVEKRPFPGLSVERVSDTQYKISWPPIEGVELYDVRIFDAGVPGERNLIAEVKRAGDTNILLDLSVLVPGERYAWELDGHMKDGRRFMTKGGFVVNMLTVTDSLFKS